VRSDATLDLSLGEEARAATAAELCRNLLSEPWPQLTLEQCAVTVIAGGITNALFKVTPPLDTGAGAVAVRCFGLNTEVFIDRERELRNLLELTAAGFGAPVLATFRNGRIEAFLDGATLDPTALMDPVHLGRIASKLKSFHSARVSEPRESRLWRTIRGYHSEATALDFSADAAKAKAAAALNLERIGREIERVEKASAEIKSPVVYCHNDALAYNFIWDETREALHVIDFEYSGFGERGFDFGNHFNEWAGFECKWGQLPGRETRDAFYRAYIGDAEAEALGPEALAAEMERMDRETSILSLASHMYWGTWAVLQAKHSAVDFDYISYAKMRFAQYDATADAILSGGAMPPWN